ncbi:uncharacterized protein LOC116766544 [Danaus plexippus]|uniref:Uncharacterized protein n=1 Tax=Danaus plexippus plexippus TaxID=278856 RepID=A0A212FFF9_DANPL|nr:uncharacterized protein LOC116766544 [Danaus plexippus]OWR52471.1 hypothetical protein KGM_214784 [Danaus plexippus plexippus]
MKTLLIIFVLISCWNEIFAIWCYQCTPATPGCMEPFNWRGIGYLGSLCPDREDICVKLIERKGAQEVITRDCLSNFKAIRKDIPADTYEGCRPAVPDVTLAHYVNNSIKQIDIKRDWYDETTWCFCFLDHRCNSAALNRWSMTAVALTILCIIKTWF